ncbi:MAG: hypothetical protein FRX49_07182 [Trebouxia sp. A1-2]|nr:MAG: hypothetical protein FRX49_07182 [Trebouxia sp. A1-2]
MKPRVTHSGSSNGRRRRRGGGRDEGGGGLTRMVPSLEPVAKESLKGPAVPPKRVMPFMGPNNGQACMTLAGQAELVASQMRQVPSKEEDSSALGMVLLKSTVHASRLQHRMVVSFEELATIVLSRLMARHKRAECRV